MFLKDLYGHHLQENSIKTLRSDALLRPITSLRIDCTKRTFQINTSSILEIKKPQELLIPKLYKRQGDRSKSEFPESTPNHPDTPESATCATEPRRPLAVATASKTPKISRAKIHIIVLASSSFRASRIMIVAAVERILTQAQVEVSPDVDSMPDNATTIISTKEVTGAALGQNRLAPRQRAKILC